LSTSLVSFAYETSSAGDPGTMTAVVEEVGEKASASVVGAILSILVSDKEISVVQGQRLQWRRIGYRLTL
jgi:hypothetical protein